MLGGDKVYVRELQKRVNKVSDRCLSVRPSSEPGGVEGHGKWWLGTVSVMSGVRDIDIITRTIIMTGKPKNQISILIPDKVSRQHPLYGVHGLVIPAGVQHGAPAAQPVAHDGEGNLPDLRVGGHRTGRDGAGLASSLVDSVGPEGRTLVAGGKAGVVLEPELRQGSEHGVPASLQEGSPAAGNVWRLNKSVSREELCLTSKLTAPVWVISTSWVGVGHTVRGDLVARPVQGVNLTVVCPLVRHEEGGRDGTAVRVQPRVEQTLIEIFVEIINSVIKR